jgi:hypothetical protein
MRLLELPKQMPANVSEFVDHELAQCVALSGRKRQSDFCVVGPGAGPRKRLLAVAADADQVGQIVKICAAAGVTAQAVEPASLAYVRVLLTGQEGLWRAGNAVVAILDAGKLVVHVLRKGALDFVRVRDLPAGTTGVGPTCAWLADELAVVLRYCHADAPADGGAWRVRLVLHHVECGKDELASQLHVETGAAPLEIVDCHELLAGGSGRAGNAAAQPPSAVAVGAAMRLLDVEGDDLRIDLLPREVVQARRASRRLLIMANAAAAVLLAILLLTEFLTQTTGAMDRRIEQTRQAERLLMAPALIEGDRYLDRRIERTQGQLAHLQTVGARREMDWPAVLDAIWQAKPAGVSVTCFLCDDNQAILLRGVAPSHGQAEAFVQSLDRCGPLASAWMTSIQRPQVDDAFEFEIHCTARTAN